MSEVLIHKYQNTIFHNLPRILLKISLSNKKYYNALINKAITKDEIINALDSITSPDDMESKIIEILKEKELI